MSIKTIIHKPLFWIFFIFVILPAFVYGGYKAYEWYQIDKSWRESVVPYRKLYEDGMRYADAEKQALAKEQEMLSKDTYGGKTPEETLKFFVDALKKKDYKLAAKYYLPWKQAEAEKEMKKWVEEYSDAVNKFILASERGYVKLKERTSGVALKIYEDDADKYPYSIEMQLNNVNRIWKISEFK